MTLLSMCRKVLAETGWPVLGSIATNSDGTAQQIMAIANTELEALSEVLTWPQLEVEYEFVAVPGQERYLFPDDYRVLASQSVFSKSEYIALRGNTGLPFWELMKYGKLSQLTRPRFRLGYLNGKPGIAITPPPVSATEYVAVYYTNKYAMDANGASVAQYSNDDDTAKVPERYVELGVKWRFRRAKGLDFSAELAEYNSTIQTQFAKYAASPEIPIGGRRFADYPTCGTIPENGFG